MPFYGNRNLRHGSYKTHYGIKIIIFFEQILKINSIMLTINAKINTKF